MDPRIGVGWGWGWGGGGGPHSCLPVAPWGNGNCHHLKGELLRINRKGLREAQGRRACRTLLCKGQRLRLRWFPRLFQEAKAELTRPQHLRSKWVLSYTVVLNLGYPLGSPGEL